MPLLLIAPTAFLALFAAACTCGAQTVTSVNTTAALAQAIATAQAGHIIQIVPGNYQIHSNIRTQRMGYSTKPITVRARHPGEVVLEFTGLAGNAVEGFIIRHPYWEFENLTLRGTCAQDSQCEHAFHVVGAAHHTVLRHNHIENFNAHLKVNGEGGQYPDDGLLQHNTLTNTARRETGQPVTPIDIVAASGWVVADNVVSNFVKAHSNQISYGMFMKGGGQNGRFERNRVVCTPTQVNQAGSRVGISLGGGNTGKAYCRDQQCKSEHTNDVILNNTIENCNDVGIDINQSAASTVAHNRLINTRGIEVRNAPGFALIHSNDSPGGVRATRGGTMSVRHNNVP